MKEVVWVAADVSVAEHIRPKVPRAGVVYGEVVYWFTILGSIISIVGATIAVLGADNHLDPSYVFSGIWQGESTTAIWEGAVGQIPNGHWYLPRVGMGDGLAMLGLAVAVFAVIPGMICSAIVLFMERERVFGTLALVAAVLCVVSCLGLIRMPSKESDQAQGPSAVGPPAVVDDTASGNHQPQGLGLP
jgi:drug/metabolite transporter (DMT)-like permease